MDKKKRNGYQESATPEKILKLHKPFSQCLPCTLASHRVIAIKIVIQSEHRGLRSGQLLFSSTCCPPKLLPYLANSLLYMNSIIYLDSTLSIATPMVPLSKTRAFLPDPLKLEVVDWGWQLPETKFYECKTGFCWKREVWTYVFIIGKTSVFSSNNSALRQHCKKR